MSGVIPVPEDNASSQLLSAVNASSLSFLTKSAEGANFTQPINGNATSGGTRTQLNSTGIQAAGVAVGDVIYNLTDSDPTNDDWAIAVVVSVSANSIVTTRLRGGSDNTWENSDNWCVNPFVINLSKRSGGTLDGTVTLLEKILITNRSTDTLSIPAASGYRGFDGTTPESFAIDDFITQEIDKSYLDGLRILLAEAYLYKTDIDDTVLLTGNQTVAGVKTFSSFPVTPSSAPTTDYQVANKKFVDDSIAGLNLAVTDLSDTPSSYSGQAGKHLRVNSAENAVEFSNQNTAAVVVKNGDQQTTNGTDTLLTGWTEISDTPSMFASNIFTIPAGGGGTFKLKYNFTAGQNSNTTEVSILKNGSVDLITPLVATSAETDFGHRYTYVTLTDGDTVGAYFKTLAGPAQAYFHAGTEPEGNFSLERIG